MKKVISLAILISFLLSSIVNSSICAKYLINLIFNQNCKVEVVESRRGCASCMGCGSQSDTTQKEINECKSAFFSYHSLNDTCSCVVNNSNFFTAIIENRTPKTDLITIKFDHVEFNFSFECNLFILPNTPVEGVHFTISSTVLLC